MQNNQHLIYDYDSPLHDETSDRSFVNTVYNIAFVSWFKSCTLYGTVTLDKHNLFNDTTPVSTLLVLGD